LTIIDTGQNPQAKALFLSGQVNVAVCPQCGHGGMLSTPLVYHDPEKELFFTFMPSELGLGDTDEQRVIGDLTNRVISSLPSEQRKGYLLRPRSFLRLEAMIEAILEADGITPEMLQAQRDRSALLERLMGATNDDARKVIAQENDNLIDYEFFQLLTMNLQMAQTQGQDEVAQQLLALRGQLLEWTTAGQEVADREEAIRDLGPEITREGLLEKLVEAALAGEKVKVETMVTLARPAIDYAFYQELSKRIEASEKAGKIEEAAALRELRERILDLTAQIDAEMQQATEQAAQLLRQILESDDLEQAIVAHLDEIDDLFLSVLAANLTAAEQAGETEAMEKLQQVGDFILKMIEESQPAEIQFINKLLNAEYPEGTQAMLNENLDQVNSQLLEIMKLVSADLAESGRREAAQRLNQIQEQVTAMVG
jgi:hypothetical protein